MENAMRFIQKSTSVELVLANSQLTVEKLLGVISESSQRIREYLDGTKLGNEDELGLFETVLIILQVVFGEQMP